MKATAVRLIGALALMAMIATACGSGRSEGSSPSTTSGGGGPDTTASDAAMFGDLASPCGEGDAKGATDQGVTDTSIAIGYGDDAGFPSSPGLQHQMTDAMKAMVKWCNEQGGINGRQITGNYHDAKITEVNNAMTEACASDFFLIGQGFALDSAQEQVRRGCGLPSVAGFAVSPQFSNAPLKWEPVPVPADYTVGSMADQLAKLFPEKVKKAAVVYANYAATKDSRDKVLSAYPLFGWNFIGCEQEYNIQGEADWKPFVQRLKDCGVEMVYFSGSPFPNFTNLLTAADQLGYDPIWAVDPNFYDESFLAWNQDGFGDNVYFRLSVIPLEEADVNPATQLFLEVVNANGGDPNALGIQSASAFLLWATAAQECGSTLTRQCVGDKLNQVHDWTGGGLHASADPGANLPPQCGLLMKLDGTSYVRVTPEEPGTYGCDPSYAAKTSGPGLERANLDENRISQL